MQVDMQDGTARELDEVYVAIGRQIVAMREMDIMHSITQIASFGRPIGGKKKSCNKGYSCGYGCISTKKACQNGLSGQAKTFADYLASVGVDKLTKPQKKDAEDQGLIKSNSKTQKAKTPDKVNAIADGNVPGNQKTSKTHKIFNEDDWGDVEPKEIADKMGIPEDKALEMMYAINSYTGINYTEMRAMQRGAIPMTDERKVEIGLLNEYINRAPKYDGQIHRGLSFKTDAERDAFVAKIQNNGGWRSNSFDSWSSDADIAKGFAEGEDGDLPGIILTTKNRSGASIQQTSSIKEENEVLVGAGAGYRLKSAPRKSAYGNYIIIEVEDAGAI